MKRIIIAASLVLAIAGSTWASPLEDALRELPQATSWIILIPPITTGDEVLSNTPYNEWQQTDSYQDQETCLQALPAFPSNYTARLALAGVEVNYGAVLEQEQHAICMAVSDPRLR